MLDARMMVVVVVGEVIYEKNYTLTKKSIFEFNGTLTVLIIRIKSKKYRKTSLPFSFLLLLSSDAVGGWCVCLNTTVLVWLVIKV